MKRVRPHEGIRLTYSPRDSKDFEFTELNTRVVYDEDYFNSIAHEFPKGTTPYDSYDNYMVRPVDLMYSYNGNGAVGNNDNGGASKSHLQVQMRVLRAERAAAGDDANIVNNDELVEEDDPNRTNKIGWVDMSVPHVSGVDNPYVMPQYGPANFVGLGPRAGDVTK